MILYTCPQLKASSILCPFIIPSGTCIFKGLKTTQTLIAGLGTLTFCSQLLCAVSHGQLGALGIWEPQLWISHISDYVRHLPSSGVG